MRAIALGRPAASVELPIAPRYLRADWLQTNRHVCFWQIVLQKSAACAQYATIESKRPAA